MEDAFRSTLRCSSGRLGESVPSPAEVIAIAGAALLAAAATVGPLVCEEAEEATDVGRAREDGPKDGGDGRDGTG